MICGCLSESLAPQKPVEEDSKFSRILRTPSIPFWIFANLAHPGINTPKDVFLQCQEGAHTMDITQHFSTGVRSHIVCVYSVTSPGHTTIHMHLADILGLLPNCWGPLSLRFRGSMHFGKYRRTVPSFNSPTEQVYLIRQVLAFLQSHAEKPWFSSKLRKERKP